MSGLGAKTHSVSPDGFFGKNDGIDGTDGADGADGLDATNMDIGVFIQAVPGDSEKLLLYVVPQAATLPASLTGSKAYADTTATAAATIDIQKNGVSIGSINFAIGANAGTFTFATSQSFAAGDRLSFINQATADATLADIAVTLRGTIV